jgi:hypothetical protein
MATLRYHASSWPRIRRFSQVFAENDMLHQPGPFLMVPFPFHPPIPTIALLSSKKKKGK